jgi:hypothetical protein
MLDGFFRHDCGKSSVAEVGLTEDGDSRLDLCIVNPCTVFAIGRSADHICLSVAHGDITIQAGNPSSSKDKILKYDTASSGCLITASKREGSVLITCN